MAIMGFMYRSPSMADILSSLMPDILNGLTGGLGGAALNVLEKHAIVLPTSKDPQAELEKIVAAADPDKLLALRQANHAFQTTMAELEVDMAAIADKNTQGARNMYVKTKDKLTPLLAVLIILSAFTFVGALMFISIPESNRGIVLTVLGLVIGYAGNVVTFYFGSSQGSRLKDRRKGQ